ncbi:MAG: hypothetical protein K0S06_1759 [Microvirga sp.]|nr:hypothetical protein [Microvirga sp.]
MHSSQMKARPPRTSLSTSASERPQNEQRSGTSRRTKRLVRSSVPSISEIPAPAALI